MTSAENFKASKLVFLASWILADSLANLTYVHVKTSTTKTTFNKVVTGRELFLVVEVFTKWK